ncbi:hypothetical protein ABW20_dc0104206 [Dactylellina cionopaga]|nr:hypothetical protein ABW20_dc0104206 [Dactylellina cionopaga]
MAAAPIPLPTDTNEKPASPKRQTLKTILRTCVITIGLYFASYPVRMMATKETTGFGYLLTLTPPKYPVGTLKRYDHTNDFWQCIGAMMIVWPLLYMPRVQKAIFCNPLMQYFGKISFALYIMHGHIHRSWGYFVVKQGLMAAGIWHMDKNGNWKLAHGHDQLHNAIIVAGFFVTMPLTIYSADLFWRGVDLQSVRFLRWLESKLNR